MFAPSKTRRWRPCGARLLLPTPPSQPIQKQSPVRSVCGTFDYWLPCPILVCLPVAILKTAPPSRAPGVLHAARLAHRKLRPRAMSPHESESPAH